MHPGGTIEGRWRLIEQSYGSGRSNLLGSEPPAFLELERRAGGWVGRVRFGSGSDAVTSDWPTLGDDHEVVVRELVVERDGGESGSYVLSRRFQRVP